MRRLICLALIATAGSIARAQENRPELKEDLWYKVTQAGDDDKYYGFVHLQLDSVSEEGRTLYHFYEEGQIFMPGMESGWREDYTFDTDMVLVRGESLVRQGDAEVSVRAVFDGKTLTRACVTPAIEQVTPWSREQECWPSYLIPFALMRRHSPWEAGQELPASTFAFSMEPKVKKDPSEKDEFEFVLSTRALVFAIKGQAKKAVVDLEQTCWMLEETARDKPQAGVISLVVDSRGLIVERSTPAYVVRRVKDDVAARNGKKFIWAHGGRRDPFRTVMKPKEVRKPPIGQKTPDPPTQKEIKALLEKAAEHLAAMQTAMNLPEQDRERILAERSKTINLYAGQIRDTHDAQAIARMNEILLAAGKLYDPARAALSTARALLKEIREKFDSSDREMLARIAALVANLAVIASSQEISGKPEQAQIAQLLQQAMVYDQRAKTMIEGMDKTKDLQPNGVMVVHSPEPFEVELGLRLLGARMTVQTTLKLPVSHSVVLIGSGSYEEGDPIAEINNLTVQQIRADGVVLEYMGERITIQLGGK